MAEANAGPQDVCFGIPIDRAYPAAPPRHTAEPPRRAAATPPPTAAESSEVCRRRSCCCFWVVTIILAMVAIPFLVWLDQNDNDPSFKLESVSVSLENHDNNNNVTSDDSRVTARWNIGFSIRNSNSQSSFSFREFLVWVRCTSQGSLVAILPPIKQDPKNTTFVNATVNSSLPPGDLSPLIQCVVFDVNLRATCKDEIREVACKDMRLRLSSNGTQGVMIGGPRSCPISQSIKVN